MKQAKFSSRQRGAAVIIMVFFFIVISLAIVQSATVGATSELRTYRSIVASKFAYVAAEAGIEDIFYRTITGKIIPANMVIQLNGATSTVSVVTISPTEKDVYATGEAGGASKQIRKLYLKATKGGGNAQFNYGAQIGAGGITMSNNATVNGLGLVKGDVYSNGPIRGAPAVLITGNAISAAEIIADQTASSTACTSDETVGRAIPNIDFAQSFMLSTTTAQPLSKVSLYLKRTSSSPSGATIRIVSDNAGVPGATVLASQSLSSALVSTTYRWVDIVFSSPPTLNPSTRYWIVLDATQHNSKYWYWCRTSTASSPASSFRTQDWLNVTPPRGIPWNSLNGVLTFKTYYGRGGKSQISDVSISRTAKADEIDNAQITGDAYYQILSGPSTVGGTSYQGSPTPPYLPLPFSSSTIAGWKADAVAGGTIVGNCGAGGVAGCNVFPLTLGPKTITGNLEMNDNQTLTISGTLHVMGNVDMSNNSLVKCAAAYGASSCMLIADGYISVGNNMNFSGSGTTGSFIMLLSTKKDCNGVSGSIGCANNNSAIRISNNTVGALFYTTDSMIDISNNAVVTAVIGYKLNLTNNTTITYDPLVSSLTFIPDSAVGFNTWSPTNWSERK